MMQRPCRSRAQYSTGVLSTTARSSDSRSCSACSICLRAVISRESTLKRCGSPALRAIGATESSNQRVPTGVSTLNTLPVECPMRAASRKASRQVSASAGGSTSCTLRPMKSEGGAASRSSLGVR